MPGLVVVIPTHSRPALLAEAVAGCVPWPVVVVDDSAEGLPAMAGVRWVRSAGETGFARAVNLGLTAAAGMGARAALVLNDDAVPLAGCIERLAGVWETQGGAVGPIIEDSDGHVTSAGIQLASWGRLREGRTAPGGGVHRVDALSGACLMVGTSWRLDPSFRHGMEDIALCQRIRAAGGRVSLVGDARCRHVGGATVDRRSPQAQRAAVSGHLRLVKGGPRTPIVLGLAVAQVVREGGGPGRLRAVAAGWRDWRRSNCPTRHSSFQPRA